jgi:hypothetical protein
MKLLSISFLLFSIVAVVSAAPVVLTKAKSTKQVVTLPNGTMWLDASKWNPRPGDDSVLVINYVHVDGNAYLSGQHIREYLPIEQFFTNFVDGMQSGNDKPNVLKKEKVTLNGGNALLFKVASFINDSPVVFEGIVFASSKGVAVVYGYSHADIFDELESEIVAAISGFVPAKSK